MSDNHTDNTWKWVGKNVNKMSGNSTDKPGRGKLLEELEAYQHPRKTNPSKKTISRAIESTIYIPTHIITVID